MSEAAALPAVEAPPPAPEVDPTPVAPEPEPVQAVQESPAVEIQTPDITPQIEPVEAPHLAPEPNPTPDIATRAELDQLERQRAVPEAAPALTPNGPLTATVNREVEAANNRRIADLRERLDVLRGAATRDFTLGNLKDRARTDFERSR